MNIPRYIERFKMLPDLIHRRNIAARATDVQLPCGFGGSSRSGFAGDRHGPEPDRSCRRGKGADSAPRCLRLVREIVATPGDAFAVRLAVISDSSSSAFIKETLATALSASETELGFNRIEALAALPAIEAALSAAADYTRIVR